VGIVVEALLKNGSDMSLWEVVERANFTTGAGDA